MGRPTFEASGKRQDVQNEGLEGLEQLIAHQVDNSRIVFLHGDVTENAISVVIAQLLHLANVNHNPIHLVVSTYGGSVDELSLIHI